MPQVPECVVCLQPYDESLHVPRLLACGHSFCELCLKRLQVPSAASSGVVIRCPECNHRTRLPAGGRQAFPKNITLLRLLPDLLKPTDSGAPTDEVDELVNRNLQQWTLIDPPSSVSESLPSNSRTVRQSQELGDELPAGSVLPSGQSLVSTSEEYTFSNQEDGNLCVYNEEGDPTWASGSWRKGRGDVMLLTDGNLVLFDTEGTGKPVWATMTQGIAKAPGPYKLFMQDDGNLVIYGANHAPTWASWSDTSSGLFTNFAGKAEMPSVVTWLQTCDTLVSRNGIYTFVNQGDGDLCIYNQDGRATWASGTRKKGNLYMQRDGDLVLYNTDGDGASSGAPIWSSGTSRRGSGPYKLIMQDDGNLVIHDANSNPTWTSNAGAIWKSFVTSELPANSTLHSGESLVSQAEEYTFINQDDGNLVTYTKYGQATWASGTGPGRLTRGDLKLFADGNLVLFDTNGTGKPVWASMSQGIARSAGPYRLVMQDDGNLVIYGNSGATWATRTLDTTSGHFTNVAGTAEMSSVVVTWLQPCDTLVSRNRMYTFVNQADGNLCVYKRNGRVTWSSRTYSKGTGNLYLQRGGDLVLYNTDGEVGTPGAPMWSSGTFARGSGPYKLAMQDDGNLVIYDSNQKPTWATNPAFRTQLPTISDTLHSGDILRTNERLVSTNGMYKFVNQGDGNLVIYNADGRPRWASGTNNRGVGNLYMQRDGLLVLHNTNGGVAKSRGPIWSSESRWGTAPFQLVMQDDGNLVIYDSNHHPTWATNIS